jgi:RNA polymerase sigma-70 factor, ECF subfamily
VTALAQLPSGGESAESRENLLIAAVLRKDRKATAEFVSCCSDWIYPFVCRRLMPRMDLVEDLMQEILVSAWRNLATFRKEAGLRAWILGIARHKVEDHYRKRIREAELHEDDVPAGDLELSLQIDQHFEVIDQERVQRTLSHLPEAYGLALMWRYRDGKSLREMAELTGRTEKAIERLLARARESFKKRWNDGRR